MTYTISDGVCSETIDAESIDEAESEAISWAQDGDWGDDSCTVRITISRGTDEVGCVEYEHPAAEPDCEGGDHIWCAPVQIVGGCSENPGVWGSGHGSASAETVCVVCGCRRLVDYGATDGTGRQYTREVYTEGYYAEDLGQLTEYMLDCAGVGVDALDAADRARVLAAVGDE